jgi:hypothetical protein
MLYGVILALCAFPAAILFVVLGAVGSVAGIVQGAIFK